jgi:trimethylamine--corrinoid protein Co-methyltransferase
MPISISLLSEEEKKLIHTKSLDILENIGVKYQSESALDLLAEAGCQINIQEKAAKIPPEVVEQALQSAPSTALLAARDPDQDLTLNGQNLYFATDGQANSVLDLETGKRRPSLAKDLEQSTLLSDALEDVDMICAMVVPHDVPGPMRRLKTFDICIRNTSKHFMVGNGTPSEIEFVLKMVDAVLGDRSRLKERPIFTVINNSVSPLQKDLRNIEFLLTLLPYQTPVVVVPLPLSGATSPITLAGSVLEANAEFLSGLVLCQLAQPGVPVIYAAGTASIDMSSGNFTSAAPESFLTGLALVEMAHFYNLPSTTGAGSPDAKSIGFQAGLEVIPHGLMGALAGADLLWGIGLLDGITLLHLPHLLLATEACRQIRRLKASMTVDQEHLLFDVITKMRFQGDYLGDPSTKKFFRKEHLLPDLFPRESYESWQSRGETEEEMATERVIDILNEHNPLPLPDDVAMEVDRLMKAAHKELIER